MPLIQETGAIVANANTFVLDADVQAYADARGLTWAGTTTVKEAAIIKAADYLRNEYRFKYRGALKQYDQPLPFPRTGLTLYRGPAVPNTVIPKAIKDAQCELAVRALADGVIQEDLDHGGQVKSETVGPISVTYADGASPETVITVVMGYLAPLLRCHDIPDFTPFFTQAEYSENFQPGTFDPATAPDEPGTVDL